MLIYIVFDYLYHSIFNPLAINTLHECFVPVYTNRTCQQALKTKRSRNDNNDTCSMS